jgi:iron complex outermembrane receptor protein
MSNRSLYPLSVPLCRIPFRPIPAAAAALVALLVSAGAAAHTQDADKLGDLDDIKLEDLANIKVTSVSKRPELLADAPASIFVITGEDIRRSGASSLPEALRLAPNLQIARVDARNYAVTARGFNNPFENKLLVLIDGRVVYSPLFSGVFWDAQDVVLEDVDRIEVISGPGATMWGANAVNGVINVITKRADQTQGTLAAAGASRDAASGAVRYGGTVNGGSYRVYGKSSRSDDLANAAGTPVLTGWHRTQTGFRTDWGDTLQQATVQGDAYRGKLHQAGTDDIDIGGANLLGRFARQTADGSECSAQAYWDYTERNQPNAFIEHLNTFDLQLQQSLHVGTAQTLQWGGSYRLASDRVENGPNFAFLPGSVNMSWASIFAQDEIALRENLRLTGGIKLERNSYTGMEVLPTLRLAWKPAADQLVWSAVSRSVRAPSRIDRDFFSPSNPPIVNGAPHYRIAGGPDFDSEVANVAELGYRAQVNPALSYSATLFYSRYDRLRTGEMAGGSIVFRNGGKGRTRGIETWANWQVLPAWRLSAGGVVQHVATALNPGVTDFLSTTGLATSDPSNHWMLRSSFDVREGQELDVTLRHNGSLAKPYVPSYTTMDVRYGVRIGRGLELSVVGQNLLDRSHPEYGSLPNRTEFERALAVKLVWRR